jgi:mannose-6-phosphate isomerase-like protein (cupin superfamily)
MSAPGGFETEVRRVDKPWGYELVYGLTDRYCGKVLVVRAGEALSLQYHERKDEVLYLQSGRAEVELGERHGPTTTEEVGPGRAFHLVPGTVHRIRALEDCVFLEASTPELDDVVRLEDRYGRAGQSGR